MLKHKILKLSLISITLFSFQLFGLSPTDDTMIDEHSPTTVNGSYTVMKVRCMNLSGWEVDALVKFDLSMIPSGVTVHTARLNLYHYLTSNGSAIGRPQLVYPLTQTWDEATTTWNNRPTYDTTFIAALPAPVPPTWVQWDITSHVQEIVDGNETNYGWMIADAGPSDNPMLHYYSKEYSDPNFWPYLELEYGKIFVDANATGANTGANWTDAYTNLQDALNHPPRSGDEIWVAAGTYFPDEGTGITSGDREASFELVSGVAVYGGFAGSESSLDERDWANNITILSGDINNVEDNNDNSYHVLKAEAVNSSTILDGFTVQDGYADGSWPDYGGGGIFIVDDSFASSYITVRNCIFKDNYAENYGCAVYSDESEPCFVDCDFIDNWGDLTNCNGGAVFLGPSYGHEPSFTRCLFKNNQAYTGGAVTSYEADASFTSCIFQDNDADVFGGGIYNNNCDPKFYNCLFFNNSAQTGGALYYSTSCNAIHTNCTFSKNSSEYYGAGIFNDLSNIEITNCVLWGNTGNYGTVQQQQFYEQEYGPAATITYSCIQDSNSNDGSIPYGGGDPNNNIDDDPMFVIPAGNDFTLLGDSPCIDTGNNSAISTSEDLNQRDRFVDGDCNDTEVVDMGAYEFKWIYVGDLDEDCDVDFADLGILSNHWLTGH